MEDSKDLEPKRRAKARYRRESVFLFEKLDRTVYKNPMSLIHFERISRCLAVC